MDFINKYRPTKISDLIVNTTAVKNIQKWLRCYKDGIGKSCMFISGGHGYAKTTSVEVILSDMNYDVHNLDVDMLSCDISVMMLKIMQKDIISMMMGSKMRKKVVVMDNMDVGSNVDVQCVLELQKLNDEKRYCPIIFIFSEHNKWISVIKKRSYGVIFFQPFFVQMREILNNVVKNENMKFSSKTCIDKLISYSQRDICQLLIMLQDLKNMYPDVAITFDMVEKLSIRDCNIGLYKATSRSLNYFSTVDDSLKLYDEDDRLPLMIHENYISHVIQNHDGDELETVMKIAESLSMGDVVSQYKREGLDEVYAMLTCAYPSYYLHQHNVDEITDIKLQYFKY